MSIIARAIASICCSPPEKGAYAERVDDIISDRASLRLAAGRSFRAPSFDEVAPAFNGNPDLQPETAWQYEMGLDYTLSPNLLVTLSGYYTTR